MFLTLPFSLWSLESELFLFIPSVAIKTDMEELEVPNTTWQETADKHNTHYRSHFLCQVVECANYSEIKQKWIPSDYKSSCPYSGASSWFISNPRLLVKLTGWTRHMLIILLKHYCSSRASIGPIKLRAERRKSCQTARKKTGLQNFPPRSTPSWYGAEVGNCERRRWKHGAEWEEAKATRKQVLFNACLRGRSSWRGGLGERGGVGP